MVQDPQRLFFYHNPFRHRLAADKYMCIYPWISCLGMHQKFQSILFKFHLCLLNLTSIIFYISSRFSASQKRWDLVTCVMIRKDFLIPWGFETPCGWTWSSWAGSAGTNLLHIARTVGRWTFHMSSETNPGCLGYIIGDYTIQWYGDYNKPLQGSLLNNQYTGS